MECNWYSLTLFLFAFVFGLLKQSTYECPEERMLTVQPRKAPRKMMTIKEFKKKAQKLSEKADLD